MFDVKETSFTYREKEYINAWFEEYKYDATFVDEAFQRLAKKTVAGANRILKNWSTNGYTTLRETRQEATNTASPVPHRNKYKKEEESLFAMAQRKANARKAVLEQNKKI